jgi:predicted kinase
MGVNMTLIVVSGAPGTGKSTMAEALAAQLSWPLLSLDTIKEALADVLGTGDEQWSNRVGDAAAEIVFRLSARFPEAIAEGWWRGPRRERARQEFAGAVEVFCHCDPGVAAARMRARLGTGRHPIHRDVISPSLLSGAAVLSATVSPLGLGAALVEVDTQQPGATATAVTAAAAALSRLAPPRPDTPAGPRNRRNRPLVPRPRRPFGRVVPGSVAAQPVAVHEPAAWPWRSADKQFNAVSSSDDKRRACGGEADGPQLGLALVPDLNAAVVVPVPEQRLTRRLKHHSLRLDHLHNRHYAGRRRSDLIFDHRHNAAMSAAALER